MARSFKSIQVEVFNVPSELIGKDRVQRIQYGVALNLSDMTSGYVKENIVAPTIVTPSSAHWLVSANHEIGRPIVDFENAEAIVKPVIGIVTYQEMAECLGWPEKEVGFQDIIDLRNTEGGWASTGCDPTDWGNKPLLAITDPTTSSTGRSLHLGLYSIFSGIAPEELTLDEVNDPAVVAKIKEFQSLIDHYQIGTTVLNTKIVEGPRYGHFFVMPEDNLIHLVEGTEEAIINGFEADVPPFTEHKLVMIYPKEGSMPRNNCACIVDADWVSEEQKVASLKWIEFIRQDDQQRKFMAAGFRPGTDISLDDPASKITAEFGLDPNGPTKNGKKVLNPSFIKPGVAAEIDRNWQLVKRPGIVNFVVDTSGSMLADGKIDRAREGVQLAISSMAPNNQVGLITFDDDVTIEAELATKLETRGDETHGSQIALMASELKAGGETALFDAVREGILSVDRAEGPADAIRAIVVLTDGQANRGAYDLDDLIELKSTSETGIGSYVGWKGTVPMDTLGVEIPSESVFGKELTIETTHDVQIFYIGVGEDADLEVGRILAQATGAHLRGTTNEDLAQVLEEFSHYF
jgi:Ca-activated chloride channel family protein